jgi:hypothetical protein
VDMKFAVHCNYVPHGCTTITMPLQIVIKWSKDMNYLLKKLPIENRSRSVV